MFVKPPLPSASAVFAGTGGGLNEAVETAGQECASDSGERRGGSCLRRCVCFVVAGIFMAAESGDRNSVQGDHGCGDDLIVEDFSSASEWLIGGDDQACAFVAAGDKLEDRFAASGSRDVADIVDHEQRVAGSG